MGDPCFDRMRVSARHRAAYRAALGARADQTIVVVSSTWGRNSLFGRHPDLISDLLGELTLDDHVVAAVLHGNVWAGHGEAQLRTWLGDALRSGLRLVPPLRGWQQAVLAADAVVGDHGAVTGYAAAGGVPTLLAAFPAAEVAPGSVIAALGERAAHLDHHVPYQRQIHHAIDTHDPTAFAPVTDLASSAPDRAADLLRATFYRLLDLLEPDHPALVTGYRPTDLRPEREPVHATWADCDWLADDEVRIRRWPADATSRRGTGPRAAQPHLVVHRDHPRRDLSGNAAAVLVDGPDEWAEVFRTRAACRLVAWTTPDQGCRIRLRDGAEAHVPAVEGADPAIVASAVYGWLRRRGTLPRHLTVSVGARTVRLTPSVP